MMDEMDTQPPSAYSKMDDDVQFEFETDEVDENVPPQPARDINEEDYEPDSFDHHGGRI